MDLVQSSDRMHNEVDVLGVRMPFKLERELVQIPYSHLRLVSACCDNMVSIASCFHSVACLGEFKTLDKFNGPFKVFPYRPFSLAFR